MMPTTGIVEFAVSDQWLIQGDAITSPLARTAIRVALGCVLLALVVYLYRRVDRAHVATVAAWTAGGALGAAALGLWVLRPWAAVGGADPTVAVAQAAIWGAAGGASVGAEIAHAREARTICDRERRRWKSLFAKSPAAIADLFVEGSEFSIVTVNDEFRDWFPVDGDWEGQPFGSVVDVDDVDEDLEAAVEAGRAVTAEFSMSGPDGTRYYRLRLVPYSYDDERRAFAILTDGTSLKAVELDLQETVSELSKKNDRLEQFADVVSHDLRNPLTIATGHLELVDAPGDEERLETIADALDRIDDLVSDLLALAREGKSVDDPVPVDLGSTARHAWSIVDQAEMDLVTDAEAAVLADEDRLQQLFENLFRNAREHAGADVTVTVGTLDGEAGFFVADDGPGVPDDEREAVFEPGYSSASDGTGLGLDIVREIARGHDWTVDLTDSADGGARIEFRGVGFP